MKKLICIECPKGCHLTVGVKGGRVVRVSGNECKKGKHYAVAEIEHPTRIVTSTVLAQGLEMKMVPVRTDKPVPRDRITEVIEVMRKIRFNREVKCQDVLIENVLGLDVNVVATRNVGK